MELTRNHYLMIGVVLLFTGIQLRYVDSFVLNETTTRIINQQVGAPQPSTNSIGIFPAAGPAPKRAIQPPPWLGWALMSIGGVVVLQSMAMPKPGGG